MISSTRDRPAVRIERLDGFVQTLIRPDTLILGEVGYTPPERAEATSRLNLDRHIQPDELFCLLNQTEQRFPALDGSRYQWTKKMIQDFTRG